MAQVATRSSDREWHQPLNYNPTSLNRQQPPPQQCFPPAEQHPVQTYPPQQQQYQLPNVQQGLRTSLAAWELPAPVVAAYASKGITRLFPWQAAALESGEDGHNLVYCAPTSGGKSLVADILMIRKMIGLCTRNTNNNREVTAAGFENILMPPPPPQNSQSPGLGRALVVLPYISIVSEKTEHLSDLLRPIKATVRGYQGAMDSASPPLAPNGEAVAVCTIEKANVCINRLLQEGRLAEMSCIVIDELHMIANPQRGVGLELLLTKILHQRGGGGHIQIIGMSATMGGLETLRKWLRARLFLTNYRPVPLTEYAVFKGTVYAKKLKNQITAAVAATASTTIGGVVDYELGSDSCPLEISRVLPQSNSKEDLDRLLPLVSEVTMQGHSVLIFCGSRRNCVITASLVAKHLNSLLEKENYGTSARISARQDLISQIEDAMSASLSPQLQETILAGVAWHHAGLSQEEKAGIEAGYRAGTLQVLAATSTLAAGVNLPARRVILRSNLIFGRAAIDRSMYLQMVGRAGRAGQSPVGEAYIIGGGTTFKQNDWNTVCKLITAPVPVLQSQLLVDSTASTTGTQPSTSNSSNTAVDSQLQRLLVESVACGAVTSSVDVQSLLHNTFAYHQHPYITIITAAKNALRALEQDKRLLQSYGPKGSMWKATTNGTAVYDSALPLDSGLELFNELKSAENGLNTTNGALHAIFLTLKVVKSSSFITIYNWKLWETALCRLNASTAAVAAAVGVETTYAHALALGDRGNAVSTEKHARFAAALVINEIAKGEDTLEEVVARWGAPQFLSYSGLARGELQKLQEDVAQHMGMASLLCESAGWWPLATLFSEHAATVAAGVRRELLPLMAVPGMTAGKARALWKGGITGPMVLATVQEEVVFKALTTGVAAQMRAKAAVGAGRYEQQQNSNLGTKAATGIASRAAKALIAAAREHVFSCVELNIAVEPAQDVPAPLQEDGHRRQEGGMSTENLNKSRETFLHNHSFCTEIRLSTSDEDVVKFFTAWAAQPRYSLTLSTSLPSSSPASSTGERVLQGFSVCWNRKEAYFVDFSQRHRTRELVFSSADATTTLEKAVASILASSSSEIILFGALSTISTLFNAAKLSLVGTLFDLEVAGRLLTPPEPVSARAAAVEGASPPPPLTLKSTLDLIAPELSKEIRVVLNPRAGVTPACRSALLLLVAAEPALRVLASRGLLDCFNLLDLPATIGTARGIYSLLGTSESTSTVSAAEILLPSSRMVPVLDSAPFSSLLPMHFGPQNVTVHTSTVHYELSNKILTPETAQGSIVALWCTPEELCHHSHRHRFHSGDRSGAPPPLLVIGRLLNIQRNGKRLRTALDFSSDLGNEERGCSMATLAVAPLPPPSVDPDCPAAVPSCIELVRPVDQLWRLTSDAVSELFTSDVNSPGQQTLGESPSTTSCDILVWQPQQQQSLPSLPSSPSSSLLLDLNTRKKNTWLSIEILNIELAVVAHLSQDIELLNACTTAAKPWSRAVATWSVEAKNVAVGGGILITSATVKAIVYYLIYGWSDARLAYELSVLTSAGGGKQQQISKQQASAAVSSFLGAFRGLKSWQEDTITAWERSYQVKTISGRVYYLPGPSANADPKLRGRMAKAAVAAMLSGSVEDVYLAAIATVNRSLIESNNGVLIGQQIGRVILTQVPEEFESATAVGHALKNKLDLGNGSMLAVPLDVSICVGKLKLMQLFLAAVVLALSNSCIHARSLTQAPSLNTSTSVIIIGAGMAGISTARWIVDNTNYSVIILEARDRSGGRLYSVPTAYGKIDYGAMWIHDGVPGNPLYDLAVSLNASLSPQQDYFSAATFTAENEPIITGSNRELLFEGWLADVISRIDLLRTDPATNVSSLDVPLSQIYEEYLAKNNITPDQQETTNLIAHTSYQVLLNANLTDLSTLRYGDAKTLPAIDVLLMDGFDTLTNIMKMEPTPLDIRYNTPVTAVNYGGKDTGVSVVTENGETFTGKYVVTTQSLGCLKKKENLEIFSPSLPEKKLKAIDSMGMGVLDKVILVFDTPFWNDTDFISREMPDLSGEWSIYLNNNKTIGVPALVALNAADTARDIELKSDEVILSEVMAVLREMYGSDIPDPSEFYVTRWASDPWACGSYSYYATGNEKNITAVLAEPVGRLLFAGEATSQYPATVLGAYMSGLREGERIGTLLTQEQ